MTLSGVGAFEVGEEFLLEAGEEFGAADFAVTDIVEGFVKVALVHAKDHMAVSSFAAEFQDLNCNGNIGSISKARTWLLHHLEHLTPQFYTL